MIGHRWLFALARTPTAGLFIGWLFAHMSFLLPVDRLRETDTLLAFHHPQPAYPVHILIVPKQRVANLMALQPANAALLLDLIPIVQSLVSEFGLETAGYRLITNGGPYQDIPQLHFHLISDAPGA
ncbi:MAG: HIT domain-containing protein [Chloroflexi bacterium]|nr:HIT domain-containing protein [Chloroflexota bacterium]